MNNEFTNMSIEQLKHELNNIDEQLIIQRRRARDGDKYEQASAQRKMILLKSKKEVIEHEYRKKQRKVKFRYKINKRFYQNTGYNVHEYYGTGIKETTKRVVKGIAAFAGISVVLYGSVWTIHQMHVNNIDKPSDLFSQSKDDNGSDLTSKVKSDNKLDVFFKSKEGKYIEKYSAIYGVDKNLAASVYIHGNGIKPGTYISAYNMQTQSHEDIIPAYYDVEDQTRAVCAGLGQNIELCNGNPVAMIVLYDQDCNKVTDLISRTGINIDSYVETIASKDFNTDMVNTILSDCPDIVTNSWYEEGHIYTRIINKKTGDERIEDSIVNDLAVRNR